jgi:glycosyltransferase involved in cell wall biosynthesis
MERAVPSSPGATFAAGADRRCTGAAVRISVITPSFNQAAFIGRTIESVQAQRGPFELEHIVVDGGSTDGTQEVLRRYEGRLRWISEPDRGQSDAINKGFRMATGDVLAWLNSDDLYEPGALAAVAEALAAGARWCFGECRVIDEGDREIRRAVSWYKNRQSRRYGFARLLGRNFIPQPAVFFRRDLLEEVGGLGEDYHLAMDYDLWLRFARRADPVFVPRPLAAFRWHGASKSGASYRTMAWECFGIARRHARAGETLPLARHFLHVLTLVGVYGALDALAWRPGASGRAGTAR